jgi:hypothetical protein
MSETARKTVSFTSLSWRSNITAADADLTSTNGGIGTVERHLLDRSTDY